MRILSINSSSSFLGLPYRILNMNPQKGTTMELIWVVVKIMVPFGVLTV